MKRSLSGRRAATLPNHFRRVEQRSRGRRAIQVERLEDRTLLNAAPVAVDDEFEVLAGESLRNGLDLPSGLNAVAQSSDGHVYGIVVKTLNWIVSRDEAAAMTYKGKAGHLVTFSSAAEKQFVLDELVGSLPSEFHVVDIWIGLSDMVNEGQFRWVTDEPVTYTSWAPGEPNQLGDEDAVEMFTNGLWNDVLWGDGSSAYIVEFDGPFQTGVLANDTDSDQDLLTAELLTNVAHGELSLGADGSFNYTPAAGFSGVDSFAYRASDGQAASETSTVTINVVSNSPPVAVDDAYEVVQRSVLTVGNRLPTGVTPVVWSTNGHAYMQVNGNVNWEQAVSGAASWEYHGVAGHLVTITSSAENDFVLTRVMRRINDEQYYIGLSDIATEGEFAWVTGEPVTFTAWGPGEPHDPSGLYDVVELFPYYGNIWNDVPPTEVNFGYFVEFEPPFHGGVLKNDSDAEGRRLRAELVADAEHGTLALADDGTFTYTPDLDFAGTDTFTYRASDSNSSSNTATATIEVLRFNSAPTAIGDHYYAAVNTERVVTADHGVLANDLDAELDAMIAELITSPLHGTVTLAPDGSFTYEPAVDYAGIDQFTYRAKDFELASDPATVTMEIAPYLDQPIARDDGYSASEDMPLVVNVSNDVRAGLVHSWTFDETSGDVAADNASGNDATLFNWTTRQDKWVPGKVGGALDFNALNHYTLTESGIDSDQYTIAFWLRVDAATGINPRIASPVPSHWVLVNNEFGRGVGFYYDHGRNSANDPNPPLVGVWEHYAVAFDFAGRFARIYRNGVEVAAAPAFSEPHPGPWMFGHNQNPGQETDSLNGALDEMRIYNRLLTADEVVLISRAPSPLANDTIDYGPASENGAVFTPVGLPTHGTLAWAPNGSFEYTPDPDYSGEDGFQYEFTALGETSNAATVTIHVNAVNDTPVATADTYRIASNRGTLQVSAANGVLANDSDVDGIGLTASLVSNPTRGTLQFSPNGAFRFTPGPSFNDTDSFQYRAFDGTAYSAPVTVEIVYDVPRITVGAHELLPDTPNQTVQLFVTGGQAVSGLNLFAQVGDGGPELTEFGLPPGHDGPEITGIDIKGGTIFAGIDDPEFIELAIPQVASAQLSIAQPGGAVAADGLLATITIDTTGFYGGTWDLKLSDVLPGLADGPFDTDFAGLPAIIEDGQLVIHEATIAARTLFYDGSEFDATDDNAIATDKQPLLPGQTATFANYSSYVGGINGLMVDIVDPLGTPSLADFAFYVGNNSDTSTWQPAPAPSGFEIRTGEGTDGSDRMVLHWADGAITNKWLMVRVKSTANTGLAADDVFYFGNAIGESGDSSANALVNATDVIGTRDNPHGPFNPAAIDDRFDFNRDRLVNATDLVIARDHATSPLTALRLIAPNGALPNTPLLGGATPRPFKPAMSAVDVLFAMFAPDRTAAKRRGTTRR